MTDQNNRQIRKRIVYRDLFIAFFRSGMVSFGGGPSGIPLIEAEVVKRYKWMSFEEFGDMVAIANALPGPINTKLAGYVGWRVRGLAGLLIALVACVLPTVVLLIVLLGFLAAFQDQRWVHGMTEAVLPVVGVMMLQMTWRFFANAKKGMGLFAALFMIALSFMAMERLNIHPALLIAATLLYVLIKPNRRRSESEERQK